MDIQILLSLQDFRNGAGGMLSDFMAKMTFLGELNSVIVIMALIYWCVSKELGTYLLMGWSGNRLVNGALKVTVCAYRPWIRDPRILPYGNAITTATGYSFPSGHTMNGATVFGGGAMRRDLPGGIGRFGGPDRLQPDLSRRPYAAGRAGGRGSRDAGDVSDAAADELDRGPSGEGLACGRRGPLPWGCGGGLCRCEALSRGL